MPSLREQISDPPDERIADADERLTRSQQAYRDLQKYRRPSLVDRDWKKEIRDALAEKYESLG